MVRGVVVLVVGVLVVKVVYEQANNRCPLVSFFPL